MILRSISFALAAIAVLNLTVGVLFNPDPASAQDENGKWVTEKQMKQLSRSAQHEGLLLTRLGCKFAKVPDPKREDVLFVPEFVEVDQPTPWGWTYAANSPNEADEGPAKAAGFEVASEEYYEVTGVTWVRCKVWYRP